LSNIRLVLAVVVAFFLTLSKLVSICAPQGKSLRLLGREINSFFVLIALVSVIVLSLLVRVDVGRRDSRHLALAIDAVYLLFQPHPIASQRHTVLHTSHI
jgi:uncharacterized membrane protein